MANISNAHGLMTIYANSIEEINKLTSILKATGRWFYNIYTDNEINISDIYNIKDSCNNFKEYLSDTDLTNCFCLDIEIDGNGRWFFINNLDNLGEWLSREKPDEEFDYHQIEKIEFALGFNVTDYEPGCQYLATDEYLLYHKKDTSLNDNLKPLIKNENIYEPTKENLMKILELDEATANDYLNE